MFGIDYFVAYESYKTPETMIKGFDVFSVGLFSNVGDCLDAYIQEVARVNEIKEADVIIVKLNKLN